MSLGFLVGIILGFFLVSGFLLWLVYIDGKKFEKAKKLFNGITFDDFDIYDIEDVTDIRMNDGTEYGRVYKRLNREGSFNDNEGFMIIDDYQLAIDKIVSMKDYQIAKARVKLADGNTYEFQRVIMDALGNIEDVYTSSIQKVGVISVYPDSVGNLCVGAGCLDDTK
ncbi:hypothetical protein K0O13_08030 [Mammaliicoccus sciuri]|uniref:hypothetical protein n=1 Tax=Mammaliicoccus sciuri TaxID=1296 RepID=UPI001C62B4EC|nr:hypothetical protein [Mammaliicoccus sciuri]QYG30048.1 hypothetical protein K0O13_08030 [Mammaliicoccus sciuri]